MKAKLALLKIHLKQFQEELLWKEDHIAHMQSQYNKCLLNNNINKSKTIQQDIVIIAEYIESIKNNIQQISKKIEETQLTLK